MFRSNFTGVEEAGDFTPIPPGRYVLLVKDTEETKTKAGDPMVKVTLEVKTEGLYLGRKVFHNVTFMAPGSKGAGFAKRWLHVIGQPYEGEVTVQPMRWRGARLEADIEVEDYEYNGKSGSRNAIWALHPVSSNATTKEADKKETTEGVPF